MARRSPAGPTAGPTRLRYVALGDSTPSARPSTERERLPNQLVAAVPAPGARREPRSQRLHLARPHRGRAAAARRPSSRVHHGPDRRQRRRPGRARVDLPAQRRPILDDVVARVGPDRILVVTIPDYTVTPSGADYGDPVQQSAGIRENNAIIAEVAVASGSRSSTSTTSRSRRPRTASLVASDGLTPAARIRPLGRAHPSERGDAARRVSGPMDRDDRRAGTVGVRRLAGVAELTSLAEVRAAAKDWSTFSSRVTGDPDVRDYPQLPLEVDPPEHGAIGRSSIRSSAGERSSHSSRSSGRSLVSSSRGLPDAATRRPWAGPPVPMVATHDRPRVLGRPGDAAELTSWGLWRAGRSSRTGRAAALASTPYISRALDSGADWDGRRDVRANCHGDRRREAAYPNRAGGPGEPGPRGRPRHGDPPGLPVDQWHLAGDEEGRRTVRAEPNPPPARDRGVPALPEPESGHGTAGHRGRVGRVGERPGRGAGVLGWGPANPTGRVRGPRRDPP